MFQHSYKVYYFRTPSNQEIKLDCLHIYKDIQTVNDLKELFTLKLRLYSIDSFDLAHICNVKTNQMEVLDVNKKISDLPYINEYQVIHKNIEKKYHDELDVQEVQENITESSKSKELDVSKEQVHLENNISEYIELDVSKKQVNTENKIIPKEENLPIEKDTSKSNKQEDKKSNCTLI